MSAYAIDELRGVGILSPGSVIRGALCIGRAGHNIFFVGSASKCAFNIRDDKKLMMFEAGQEYILKVNKEMKVYCSEKNPTPTVYVKAAVDFIVDKTQRSFTLTVQTLVEASIAEDGTPVLFLGAKTGPAKDVGGHRPTTYIIGDHTGTLEVKTWENLMEKENGVYLVQGLCCVRGCSAPRIESACVASAQLFLELKKATEILQVAQPATERLVGSWSKQSIEAAALGNDFFVGSPVFVYGSISDLGGVEPAGQHTKRESYISDGTASIKAVFWNETVPEIKEGSVVGVRGVLALWNCEYSINIRAHTTKESIVGPLLSPAHKLWMDRGAPVLPKVLERGKIETIADILTIAHPAGKVVTVDGIVSLDATGKHYLCDSTGRLQFRPAAKISDGATVRIIGELHFVQYDVGGRYIIRTVFHCEPVTHLVVCPPTKNVATTNPTFSFCPTIDSLVGKANGSFVQLNLMKRSRDDFSSGLTAKHFTDNISDIRIGIDADVCVDADLEQPVVVCGQLKKEKSGALSILMSKVAQCDPFVARELRAGYDCAAVRPNRSVSASAAEKRIDLGVSCMSWQIGAESGQFTCYGMVTSAVYKPYEGCPVCLHAKCLCPRPLQNTGTHQTVQFPVFNISVTDYSGSLHELRLYPNALEALFGKSEDYAAHLPELLFRILRFGLAVKKKRDSLKENCELFTVLSVSFAACAAVVTGTAPTTEARDLLWMAKQAGSS